MLLFQILDRIKPSRQFGAFNPSNTTLTPSSGNTVVNALSATVAAARSDMTIQTPTSNVYYAEFFVWGANGAIPQGAGTAPDIRIGIVNGSANMANPLGVDTNGFGLKLNTLASGSNYNLYNNNTALSPFPAPIAPEQFKPGVWIQMIVDLTAGSLNFYVDYGAGLQAHTGTPLSGLQSGNTPLYFAVSANSDTSGNIASPVYVLVNSGQYQFKHPYNGVVPWAYPRTVKPDILFSDLGYMANNANGNLNFPSRVVDPSTLKLVKALNYLPWGAKGASGVSDIAIHLINTDGLYDTLAMNDFRDAQVLIAQNPTGGNLGTTIAKLILNAAVAPDSTLVQIGASSTSAMYEGAVQNQLLPPNADKSTTGTGQCFPILYGWVNSVTPLLLSSATLNYALQNGKYAGIVNMRDNGYLLNPLATTPDYTRNYDGTYTKANAPVGTLTADIGPFNACFAGAGGVASASTTITTGYAASFAINGDRTGAVWGTNGGWSSTQNTFPNWLAVAFAAPTDINRIVVVGLQDNYTAPIEPTDTLTSTLYGIKDFLVEYSVNNGGSYTTLFTVTGNNLVKRTFDFTTINAVTNVRITVNNSQEATNGYARIVELEAYAPNPRTLYDFVYDLLVNRALDPNAATDIVKSSFDSVATAAGYTGVLGYYATANVKVADALQTIMQSFSACIVTAPGSITAVRLIGPETQPSGSFSITSDQILGDVKYEPDYAPNLSTQAVGGKNYANIPTFSTDVSVTPTLRNSLTQPFRIQCGYAGRLADMYNTARTQKPIETILQTTSDVQSFIDYLCGLYKIPRAFLTITVPISIAPAIGSVGTFTYSRFGFSGGKLVIVVNREDENIGNTSTIRFWF